MSEAVILAGGFGTRLRAVVSELPKPMAPVWGVPFLEHVLRYAAANGITRAVLAVGYKAEAIQNHFGDHFEGVELRYSLEETPLGTGGAIKQAMEYCEEDAVFVLNGDTFFDVDLQAMAEFHQVSGAPLTLAVKPMRDFDRYGTVEVREGRVTAFQEKQFTAEGLINGGVYLLERELLGGVEDTVFSFESKVLEAGRWPIAAFRSDGFFIDIGIPEDYEAAQIHFAEVGGMGGEDADE